MGKPKLKEHVINRDWCKGCGICFTECPRHAITMIDEEVPLKEDD